MFWIYMYLIGIVVAILLCRLFCFICGDIWRREDRVFSFLVGMAWPVTIWALFACIIAQLHDQGYWKGFFAWWRKFWDKPVKF